MVFTGAGIWGLLILTPLYFLFDFVGGQSPPALTHPEYYFGFLAAAVPWQLAFLVIGRDPARFEPLMYPAVCEKMFYVTTLFVLYAQRRVDGSALVAAVPDFVIGCLFIAVIARLRAERAVARASTG
jgi:hypothetical protein